MSRNRRRSNGAKPTPPEAEPTPDDDTEPMTRAPAAEPAAAAPTPAEGVELTSDDPSVTTDAGAPTTGPSRPTTGARGTSDAGAGSTAAAIQPDEPDPSPEPAAVGGLPAEAGSNVSTAAGAEPSTTDDAGAPAAARLADAAPPAAASGDAVNSDEAVSEPAPAARDEGPAEDDADVDAAAGGEAGPSADESLSVEMAAGRVQQPPQQRRSRQRGVRAALATLPVPEPGPSFWADFDAALADQAPLAIAARPAIRPITEPPPLSQPKLSDYLESTNLAGDRVRRTRDDSPGSDLARPPGRAPDFGLGGGSGRGRKLLAAIVVIVLGLLIAGTIMGDGNDEPSTSTGADATAGDQATTTAPPADAAPTTAPAVPGLEPEARLTPLGIGPLQIGLTLGEINAAGITPNVDQPTFDASSGACFDGRPAGAADLTLRFHGPEPGAGVADPAEGVLGAVSIRDVDGSLRATETEIGLGSPEELVLDAHAGALEVSDNPSRPGGHVYLARSADNPDIGIAYATDGRQVTEISVGEVDLIGLNQACA